MKKKSLIVFLLLISALVTKAQLIQGGFMYGGLNRTYAVYLPVMYNDNESLPLLLALHGYTQNGQAMMTFSGFNNIADTAGFIVVYPDGVGNAWNVGFTGGSTADDVGFLSALIDTLHQRYNIDLIRVYSTGFSNGGFMSYRLACELSNRISAIAPVAGTMTEQSYLSCQPFHPIPLIHIHGTNDLVVNYNGGFLNTSVDQVIAFWNTVCGCPELPYIENLPDLVAEGSTVQKFSWAPCEESAEIVLLKVINGGHTWPGSVGVTGIGITNRDINASSEIWNFVKRFSLQNTTGVDVLKSSALKIYPNPVTHNQIVLELPRLIKGSEIKLFSSNGTVVLHQEIKSDADRIILDISGITPGLYLVHIYGAAGYNQAKLLIR